MTHSFSITETDFIERLTRGFSRSPLQINGLQASDAELVRLPGEHGQTIAITTDSIVEEIESGLYSDPRLIGWMTVMASLSDLAAVGAQPIGMVISEVFPETYSPDAIDALQSGIRDALSACGTFLLGGDTNSGETLLLTGCALGIIDGTPITRIGAQPGDLLYSSGFPGIGNAFALTVFAGTPGSVSYMPCARLTEGVIIRRFASSCMDTSDGVISTLDQMMRINGTGYCIDKPVESMLEQTSYRIARESGIPPWLLLAGQHGEFELLFTIPPKNEEHFLHAAKSVGWHPIPIGGVIAEPTIAISIDGRPTQIDTAYLRNLATHQTRGAGRAGARHYIEGLLEYAASLAGNNSKKIIFVSTEDGGNKMRSERNV